MKKFNPLFAAAALFAFVVANSEANGPTFDTEESSNPHGLRTKTKTEYDYDVKKNILTGSRTYIEKAEGEVKVGDEKYRQKYQHKRKVSKDGRVILDEEISRTVAE